MYFNHIPFSHFSLRYADVVVDELDVVVDDVVVVVDVVVLVDVDVEDVEVDVEDVLVDVDVVLVDVDDVEVELDVDDVVVVVDVDVDVEVVVHVKPLTPDVPNSNSAIVFSGRIQSRRREYDLFHTPTLLDHTKSVPLKQVLQ